jgi:small neutral amino acid transporter SnatA (MarC family)
MLKILWITLLFSVIIFLPIEIVSTIISEVIKNDVISIVWGILAFLLFSLSYEMLFTSMYRRILLKNNQKEISEEKQEIV